MANRNQIQTALHKPYDKLLFAKEVLSPVFGSGFSLSSSSVLASVQPNKTDQTVIDSVSIYGNITLEDNTEITCYEILLQPIVRIEQSKVAIQRYVRKLLTAGQAALVNFVAPQNKNVWRLTLVAKDSELTDEGIKEKTTHAKRYTYLLGPNETCKTAAERFETLSTERQINFQALVNAFSVEKLSKAFFDEYTFHYENFCDYLQDSNYRKSVFKISFPANASKEDKDKACKPIRDFTKKLLGRIVFLYFVQKKGWLGASNMQYKDGLIDFMKLFFKSSGGNETFYSNWLTVLFFETLNKERTNDDFKMPDGSKVKVPFLNGGLFDKEEHDEHILTFKSKLFHNPDFEDSILTEKNRTNSRGFLDFLNSFNFTVHEDSPDDHTVAVDPEMLGHIFENLLEDNKDKGAYYTPKKIVHYMCQESLTEYLTTHLSKEFTVYRQLDKEQIELFGNDGKQGQLKMMVQLGDKALNRDDVAYIVKHKDISQLTNEQLKRIDALLNTVKICDPAIGSGAFPMGLLQEIHAIKELIAYELKYEWKPADVKENIIQNSIYGVDIEKGAVDIARLRFWLSLVVDEEKPRALPNLDYKIVVGDSLVSKFENEIIEIDWERKQSVGKADTYIQNVQRLLKEIAEKQKKFFKPDKKDKKKQQSEIRNLKLELLINQLSINKEIFLGKNIVKGGFMPTAADQKFNAEIKLTKKNFENLIDKLQDLKKKKDEPFEHFDWKLDFPEVLNPNLITDEKQRGFDIVIGNPPYLNVELMSAEIKEVYKKKFETFYKRSDIFSLFIDFSASSLAKKEGHLAFIIPSIVLNNLSYKPLRNKLLNNQWLNQVCYTGNKIFQEATVDTVILLLSKQPVTEIQLIDALDFKHFKRMRVVPSFFEKFDNVISVSGDVNSNKMFERIFAAENINIEKHFDVFQGIVTGNNPVYIFDEKEQWKKLDIEKELLQPLLHGRDFNKWIIKSTDRRILYVTEETGIKPFPKALKYLTQFKSELSSSKSADEKTSSWWCLHRPRVKKNLDIIPKIIIQNTRNERLKPRIVATVDEIGIYGSQGLNFVIPTTKEYSVYFLIGIINSALINYLFATKFLNLAIKADYIKQISFPKPTAKEVEAIEKTTKEILSLKTKNATADYGKQDKALNKLIYQLYNISEEEQKIIEEA